MPWSLRPPLVDNEAMLRCFSEVYVAFLITTEA